MPAINSMTTVTMVKHDSDREDEDEDDDDKCDDDDNVSNTGNKSGNSKSVLGGKRSG